MSALHWMSAFTNDNKEDEHLVFGCLRKDQLLLDHEKHIFYVIPELVRYTILLFYGSTEKWNGDLKSDNIVIRDRKVYAQDENGSSSICGYNAIDSGCHEWVLKVIDCQGKDKQTMPIIFGIVEQNKFVINGKSTGIAYRNIRTGSSFKYVMFVTLFVNTGLELMSYEHM